MNLGLVQNGMLWGLFALAIPIIIHLLFRQKPRLMPIGSVRFLKQIMEKHRNRRRVMRWMLMSLRMLAVALFALLFARPFTTEKAESKRGDKFVGILIDRSASMQLRVDGVRLIDTAVEDAKKIILRADGKTRFEIAYFDHRVEPVTTSSSADPSNELVSQLVAPSESYSATDYAAALRWAHDVCTNAKTKNKEVHVLTDLQQSGLAWSEVEPMPDDVLVRIHDLGRDLPNNVAITSSSPSRLVVRPGESTRVRVSLLNAGPFPLEALPVVLSIRNGNRTIREQMKVNLDSGSTEIVEFEMPDLDEGLWQGRVRIESIDNMPFDNQRHLAIMSAPQYRVLIIDGDPHETNFLSETHYLQSALRLAPAGASYAASPYLPISATASELLPGFDLVLMANVERVSQRDAERLRDYVESGKGLVIFAGEQVSPTGYQALADAGLVPGEITSFLESFDLPWRIENWDRSHSIFTLFNDPQHGNIRRLAFRGITAMKPIDVTNVVASFGDGKPFLMEQKVGDKGGSVIWIATSCDNEWSSWTESELYVPIVHQVLGHLTGLNTGGPIREELIDSTGASLTANSPGIHRKNKSWQIINVNPRESEMERCSVNDFVSRFELNVGDQDAPVTMVRAALGSPLDVRQNEVWHFILFALVIILLAEFSLANRTVV